MLRADDPLAKYQDVLELKETVVAGNNKDISFMLFLVIGCNFLGVVLQEIWSNLYFIVVIYMLRIIVHLEEISVVCIK